MRDLLFQMGARAPSFENGGPLVTNSDADFLGEPQLDYDAWREGVRKACGRYNPEGIERNAFTGWIRPFEVCGFKALGTGCNSRSHRARLS